MRSRQSLCRLGAHRLRRACPGSAAEQAAATESLPFTVFQILELSRRESDEVPVELCKVSQRSSGRFKTIRSTVMTPWRARNRHLNRVTYVPRPNRNQFRLGVAIFRRRIRRSTRAALGSASRGGNGFRSGAPLFFTQQSSTHTSTFSAAMKASCGISTLPNWRMRFLPSFCFSRSLRLRVTSPP